MKIIIRYIQTWIKETDKIYLLLVSLLTAISIYLNYEFGLRKWLLNLPVPFPRFIGWYILLLFCFGGSYLIYFITSKNKVFKHQSFRILFFAAPAIFALKMTVNPKIYPGINSYWDLYINQVLYWPALLLMVMILLFATWQYRKTKDSFYGLTINNFNWQPYALMILIMVPAIAIVSTQPDFLHTYPKLKLVLPFPDDLTNKWFYAGIFELSYGIDFLTVELFFRGFLVLAFVKYAGKNAILSMACFYCAIHFGKPMAECISSYFGGILLGIIAYNTRSIMGGLMVHVGIAWLMEVGGYLGNVLKE